jgi:hypothetical protein
MSDARLINAKYAGTCASCDDDVNVGDRIYYHPATKLVWHHDCPEPPDVDRSTREIAALKKLGLVPHEFGSAPMLPERVDEPEIPHDGGGPWLDDDDDFDHNDLLPPGEIFGDR